MNTDVNESGTDKQKQRTCFVIAPIGEEGDEVRTRSDQVLQHIISPVVQECGYEAVRADTISEPGMITSQIIQHVIEDPLVVADLTGRNPNVFYELAIRHAVRLPMVQIIKLGDTIPFDVAQSRTIQVDHHDLDSVDKCKKELVRQIRAVENNPADVDTPISHAVDFRSLRQSANPLEKSTAEIISMLQEIRGLAIQTVNTQAAASPLGTEWTNELMVAVYRLASILDQSDSAGPTTPEGVRQARRWLRQIQSLLDAAGSQTAPLRAHLLREQRQSRSPAYPSPGEPLEQA